MGAATPFALRRFIASNVVCCAFSASSVSGAGVGVSVTGVVGGVSSVGSCLVSSVTSALRVLPFINRSATA